MENPAIKRVLRNGEEAVINATAFDPETDVEVGADAPPPKKKRGRPRKIKAVE